MEKRGVKSGDFEGFEEGKTANGLEFPGGRQKSGGKPGIYIVKSERVKTVGFFSSFNYEVRVRKLRSDYKRGKRRNLLERMAIALAGDVVFEEVEPCEPEIFGIRLRRLAEEWIGRGYEVYGWTGGKAGNVAEQREWGPCGRLRELADRHGMDEAGVMELLDQMDTVLGAGAAPTGPGGD